MSKFKYTLGPWDYGIAQNYQGFYIAPTMKLPTLAACEVFNYPDSTEANAKLIAAAPEMLEALIDICSKFQSIVPTNTKYSEDYQKDFLRMYDKQIKVIEKATGMSWKEIVENE